MSNDGANGLKGPMNGYRVVDLTSVVSGPATTAMMADQGADVIKVEAPSGDVLRRGHKYAGSHAPSFISCNRGKRSITLDLKQEAARDIVWKLLETADVLVQNNRPGAMERLGLGADEVRARYPRLIYASISGVGETGPYSGKRVYDPIIQALSGLADIQSDPISGRPKMIRTLIADKITAVYTAQAITAALLHRERTGEGQHVRVSMLDAVVSFIWPEGMGPFTAIAHEQADARNSPHDMIFETADGFLTVGTVSDAEWKALCQALEHPEWIEDPRFLTNALRSQNRQERLRLIEDTLKGGATEKWLSAFDKHDVPCAPVQRRMAVLSDAQVRNNQLIVEMDQPNVGPVRQARPAARFEASPAVIAGPAPELGGHTADILDELGLTQSEISALRSKGALGNQSEEA